jgi:hypothetical protein
MWQFLNEIVHRTLTGFGERLAAFGPNLLAMLVLLMAGLVIAWLVREVLRFLLPRLGFDAFAERFGLADGLRRGGLSGLPSAVLASMTAWAVLATFVILAIGALNLQFAMQLLSQAFAYLPQMLIALALLAVGMVLSGFVRRSVLIAAVNAGLPSARFLAAGTRTALLVLFAAMALEHLGVGRQVLLAAFTILFGGVVLALALAFGLAGRDLAGQVLERLARRQEPGPPDDLRHV